MLFEGQKLTRAPSVTCLGERDQLADAEKDGQTQEVLSRKESFPVSWKHPVDSVIQDSRWAEELKTQLVLPVRANSCPRRSMITTASLFPGSRHHLLFYFLPGLTSPSGSNFLLGQLRRPLKKKALPARCPPPHPEFT